MGVQDQRKRMGGGKRRDLKQRRGEGGFEGTQLSSLQILTECLVSDRRGE